MSDEKLEVGSKGIKARGPVAVDTTRSIALILATGLVMGLAIVLMKIDWNALIARW